MVAQAGPLGDRTGVPVVPQEQPAEVALIVVLSPTTVAHVGQIAQAGWDGPVLAVGSVEEARALLENSWPPAGERRTPYRPARPQLSPAPETPDRAGLSLDPDRRKVVHHGHECTLTPLEFGVLEVLMQRPGQIQRFAELTRLVWGTTFTGDSAHLHAVVRRLRRKLEGVRAPVELVAVRGVGFRLSGVVPVDDPRTRRSGVGDVPWAGSVASP
ncbi:winged helix-turn-helix domain-containing protein [Ornithinimicrobium pratense]|uniref:Winged helix-turn-helix transcriptional regulator n=1 Tax=Ornithinimicrobium pratense TaxID=2593973 RepID=A0A5J6V701_9MICO|nr:winged helix-turn-helix domain-containing protein [Ornithinimicrobium pratense]QFG68822.1 winged helix-turn-helix transcriptional regulator [Ornithinimicrobium pratense]